MFDGREHFVWWKRTSPQPWFHFHQKVNTFSCFCDHSLKSLNQKRKFTARLEKLLGIAKYKPKVGRWMAHSCWCGRATRVRVSCPWQTACECVSRRHGTTRSPGALRTALSRMHGSVENAVEARHQAASPPSRLSWPPILWRFAKKSFHLIPWSFAVFPTHSLGLKHSSISLKLLPSKIG